MSGTEAAGRGEAGPAVEITLAELLADWNWAEVFADANSGNVSKDTEAVPPGSPVDTTPANRADVAEIIAAVNGENDVADWLGLFRLKDGRYLVASGGCDYTGWDCQAGNQMLVASSLDDALRFGLSADERARLRLPEPADKPVPNGEVLTGGNPAADAKLATDLGHPTPYQAPRHSRSAEAARRSMTGGEE